MAVPGVPEKLYAQFDGSSPEGRRTIYFSATSVQNLGNEYNIRVVNTDGTPSTGAVAGMVNFEAWSPQADMPETPDNQVDLSTGCRKFRLFFATIERVVFSVTGLTPGRRLVVSAIKTGRPY